MSPVSANAAMDVSRLARLVMHSLKLGMMSKLQGIPRGSCCSRAARGGGKQSALLRVEPDCRFELVNRTGDVIPEEESRQRHADTDASTPKRKGSKASED